jgi:hypothetical protein
MVFGRFLSSGERRAASPVKGSHKPGDIELAAQQSTRTRNDRTPPLACLTFVQGSSQGTTLDLDCGAFTLGTDNHCQAVLSDGKGDVAPEHARIWYRQGKFMLHHLSRHGQTKIDGRSVTWAVLESGDEIEIGPYCLRFELRNGTADSSLNSMDEKPPAGDGGGGFRDRG